MIAMRNRRALAFEARSAGRTALPFSARRPLTFVLLVPLLALSACAAAPGADPAATGAVRAEGVSMRDTDLDETDAVEDVVAATSAIGLAALSAGAEDGNVVVSPASLATALAMLSDGARAKSLQQLEDALGASGEDRRDAFAALQRSVLELDGDPAEATAEELPERPILHLANNVVVHEGFEVHESYLDALADGFDAGVQQADLTSDAGKAVLDEWVEHHTGGLIEQSAIQPHPFLRVVLQDAILLAARWQTPFSSTLTRDQAFTLADGSMIQVETMGSDEAPFAYAELDGGWVGVRLPYQEGAHADLLLPPAGTDPSEASPELLAQATRALGAADPIVLDLTLPTLDISGDEPLDLIDSGLIADLGIDSTLCSSGEADLSGIALEPGDLCLEQAAQQAVLRVDEEGTVAAAVTELGVHMESAPATEASVHFDRPFLFTIGHAESEWPLFYAAIRDPRH
ncbi:serpin family protein [Leucobacter weissii]|uniref:Serpin family protein n=1 Tax=Leucobacter weissii TaxID=1983706 RepID=A0A939SCN9_9MICO|nr:serpin family protein [Leucobacter weissii]MBO1902635.1 serpin family protein [Leucobacter weissii]